MNEAQFRLLHEVQRSLREGDGWFPEADGALNDASRAVIAAMAVEHGEAWLGEINGYARADWRPLWRWAGTLVYNFGADFVLPSYDVETVRLLRERAEAVWDAREDAKRIERIFQAVQAARGCLLHWS